MRNSSSLDWLRFMHTPNDYRVSPFKEIARQSGRLLDGGKYIYVFSLKGEPLCKYVLDHYIYGIWVDEATKTIIATDVNNDEPILKFNFG